MALHGKDEKTRVRIKVRNSKGGSKHGGEDKKKRTFHIKPKK